MKKIFIIFILSFFYSNCFAWVEISNNSPVLWVVDSISYPQTWLNIEKIVFQNNINWVKVDASSLVSNPNSDLSISWNFWIKWVSENLVWNSGWASFNHSVWTPAKLVNKWWNKFELVWFAWSKYSGWIYFWDTLNWNVWWKVIYDRATWLFSWAWWSYNLGWIPMDWLKLITTAPTLNLSNNVFEANNNKVFTINSLSNSNTLTTIIENNNWINSSTYAGPNITHDFRKVLADGYDYNVVDEFWNKTSGVFTVVAAAPNSNTITNVNTFSDSKLADWNYAHSITLTLKDVYWNIVKSEEWIKSVSVDIVFQNNVDKDQVLNNNTWNAILFESTDFSWLSYLNTNSTASNITWIYKVNIKSLAPTSTAYSYTSNNNDIKITNFSYEVKALNWYNTVWETNKQYVYGNTNNSVNLKFTPLVEINNLTTNSNILRDVETKFDATVVKNSSKTVSDLQLKHILDVWTNLMMSYQNLSLTWWTDTQICVGYNKSSVYYKTDVRCNLSSNSSSNILSSKSIYTWDYTSSFLATPKIVTITDPIFWTNYSSNLSYIVDWSTIKYPSLSKNFTDIITSQQIKVAWLANKWIDVLNWANTNFINTNSIKRSEFKARLLKNVTKLISNAKIPANIIYSKWSDISLNNWSNTKDLIVVEWADLIITWDIYKNNKNKLNSIVLLKDKLWNGWNIWIDKDVKFISAIIYADWHIISWNKSTNTYYSDTQWWAVNQLFIKWLVISQNTIWWASSSQLVCPYPIHKADCTEILSKRYDLNHFRHFINTVVWVSIISQKYWEDNVDMTKTWYTAAPMIIEYDPLIQTATPYIYRVNN